MNGIYLIYGEEEYLINNEINKLKDKYSGYDIVTYDMLEQNISDAIEDASMISLFSSTKLIICYNCYFLTAIKCDIEHDVESLMKYMKNENDSIIILTVNGEVDNRKKIVKELNKFNVVKYEKLKEFEVKKFVIDYCKHNGFKIEEDAIKLFLEKLTNDLYIITSELEKLFIYKNNKIITKSDIEDITSRVINTNIFDLINSIVEKDIDKSLRLYDDLVIINEEEIKLIVTLANQFRLIYQVKTMFKGGYSEFDISKKLDIHPFRIKLANAVCISLDECLEYLKKLSILDEEIKTGMIDKKNGFIKFILSL
ncbi:MAG: DNA polymerase III subunit delta [Bacilli bacterium]|nr:DNA polymerase III subunit delta [Bacilli bacterium]